MTIAEPVQVTKIVAEVFERLQIPYFVGGSLASSLYGIPRATADVDIIADIKSQHTGPLVQALKKTFYVNKEMVKKAIKHRSSFNIIYLSTVFKVDIFVLKQDAISQEEMKRRKKYQMSEDFKYELYVASLEDTILSKLHWFQLGGRISQQQWNDVLGILRVQNENLDFSYLRKGAEKREVTELLKKAFVSTGIKCDE